MYNSTMRWFSFLLINLVFTSRKSLAGLVTGFLLDKYEEFSNIKAAVSFFFFLLFLNLYSTVFQKCQVLFFDHYVRLISCSVQNFDWFSG